MEKNIPTNKALTKTIINTFMLGETLGHFQKNCFEIITSPEDLLQNYKNYLQYGGCAVSWKEAHKANQGDLKDGWGNDFVYELRDGETFLTSLGKDGSSGGEGDNADLVYNMTRKEFLEKTTKKDSSPHFLKSLFGK